MLMKLFMNLLLYAFVGLTLAFASCGGEGGGAYPRNMGDGQAEQVSGASERTPMLRGISITPGNPLGIIAGTRLQFAATGSYTDNSVQDLTAIVVWTSSDTSIAADSNEADSKGQVTAVSKGYCSISATLGSVSGSIIMGVY
jgi:hypothetical protein